MARTQDVRCCSAAIWKRSGPGYRARSASESRRIAACRACDTTTHARRCPGSACISVRGFVACALVNASSEPSRHAGSGAVSGPIKVWYSALPVPIGTRTIEIVRGCASEKSPSSSSCTVPSPPSTTHVHARPCAAMARPRRTAPASASVSCTTTRTDGALSSFHARMRGITYASSMCAARRAPATAFHTTYNVSLIALRGRRGSCEAGWGQCLHIR